MENVPSKVAYRTAPRRSRARCTSPECRFSSQNIRTLISIWQSAKISKYRQNIKIKFRFKIAKYRLYRRRFWRSRRHFSAFFKLYQKKKAENASELQKSHKTFAPKFWKFSKIRQNVLYFDILAVCSILIFYWYFVLVFWNLRKSAASTWILRSYSLGCGV